MFSFLRVNKVATANTAETGVQNGSAHRAVPTGEMSERRSAEPASEQRVKFERRLGGDRRQNERNCTVGVLFDTRARSPRRKVARRQEDMLELRQFKIEI